MTRPFAQKVPIKTTQELPANLRPFWLSTISWVVAFKSGKAKKFSHFCIRPIEVGMTTRIYQSLTAKKLQGLKSFAVLIDPDKADTQKVDELTALAISAKVDYLFVGG